LACKGFKVYCLYIYVVTLKDLSRGMMKGREINIVKFHGLWNYKGCYFFPFWCLNIVCETNCASIYILHHLEKGDKQYGTNFWEGETFSCSHNTRTF